MKFEISCTSSWVDTPTKIKYEKYGLKFVPETNPDYKRHGDWYKGLEDGTIELNSLEDLVNLIKDVGDVIVGEKYIEIYDNYRE